MPVKMRFVVKRTEAVKLRQKIDLSITAGKFSAPQRHLSWPCGHLILVMTLEISCTKFAKMSAYFSHRRFRVFCLYLRFIKDYMTQQLEQLTPSTALICGRF
jgi:hypothetical protein